MAIISRLNKKTRTPYGLRISIILVYALLLAVLLIIVNHYPVRGMKDRVTEMAKQNMSSDSLALATSLGKMPAFNTVSIGREISSRNLIHSDRRIVVTDSYGAVIYDSKSADSLYGRVIAYPEVITALMGQSSFYCAYDNNVFNLWAASPIMNGDFVRGSVYIYECDADSGLLLKNTIHTLKMVSVAVIVLSVICLMLFNKILGKRLSKLLDGVREAGSGNFNYRINLSGSDELAKIATEFNDLSARIQENEMTRRRFVSDASHELKTPLASIKLLSDSIAQNKNLSRETLDEFLQDISGEIVRLIRISEELIAINKVDSVNEEKYICDVGETVEKAVERLKVNAETAKVDLSFENCDGCTVYATDDGIYHIVFNLVENAIKYNREGGKVRVRLKKEGESIKLSVLDTGIGIPEHDKDRIFERFFRVDKNRSRATGGTGLGLSIVKEWADKFDAEIKLESFYGEGSEFTVVFPYCTAGEAKTV